MNEQSFPSSHTKNSIKRILAAGGPRGEESSKSVLENVRLEEQNAPVKCNGMSAL